jgi:hypothetical protein
LIGQTGSSSLAQLDWAVNQNFQISFIEPSAQDLLTNQPFAASFAHNADLSPHLHPVTPCLQPESTRHKPATVQHIRKISAERMSLASWLLFGG